MNLTDGFSSYLRAVIGESAETAQAPSSKRSALPHFLADTYELHTATVAGHTFYLAFRKVRSPMHLTATLSQHAALTRSLAGDVALVFGSLSPYQRRRLIEQRVPFAVPGSQMYLPFLATDLRERTHQEPTTPRRLSMPAQALVLVHLQRERVGDCTLRCLAGRLRLSPMTLSRVSSELAAAGLCASGRQGREKPVRFVAEGQALWEAALPLVRSPVARTVAAVRSEADPAGYCRAGASALSRYTGLGGQDEAAFAVSRAFWREELRSGRARELPEPDTGAVEVQVWGYDPGLLAEDGAVDRLSLYLSMRGDPDERVQAALNDMLEAVKW